MTAHSCLTQKYGEVQEIVINVVFFYRLRRPLQEFPAILRGKVPKGCRTLPDTVAGYIALFEGGCFGNFAIFLTEA